MTAPLSRALATGRVHHAYLFSGPRGCGKTSTARILARSLNCEQGPTPVPCGVCESCVDLAPNGPGSEDVIELDAASHGGVDDTRELRERVIYSPARARYRIYIIDEAHMVSTQGFNALLKVIEEPPDYVRFIFATTEPEKVLGTIRSRTFNYAFRLVSVGVLSAHLASVCKSEGVPFDTAALPLVARASGGSVRDALSVLGQLIAGSGDEGLTTQYVSEGLGLTDAVLLDRVVSAIAARDGAAAFAAVDAVVESGHDGRRFLTDLLSRLRDLIVLGHVPQQAHSGLLQLPDDQVEALRGQVALFGPAELSRAADLVSAGLSGLKGATSPRLQMELLLARLLLPAADDEAAGIAARLDRLERSAAAGVVHAAPPGGSQGKPQRAPQPAAAPSGDAASPPAPAKPAPAKPAPAVPASATPTPAASGERRRAAPPPRLSDLAPATRAEGGARASESAAPPSPPAQAGEKPTAPAPAAGMELETVRQSWPAVLSEVGKRSRVAWTLWDSSHPAVLGGGVLTVAVADQGRLTRILASRREELLRQVLIDVLKLDVKVSLVLNDARPAADEEQGAASPDDPDIADNQVSGVDLVMRELGAVPIGEIGES